MEPPWRSFRGWLPTSPGAGCGFEAAGGARSRAKAAARLGWCSKAPKCVAGGADARLVAVGKKAWMPPTDLGPGEGLAAQVLCRQLLEAESQDLEVIGAGADDVEPS